MKILFETTAVIVLLLLVGCQTKNEKDGLIPLSTSSIEAKEYYNKAYQAMIQMDIKNTSELINSALKEDSSFFMAKYLGLVFNLHMIGNEELVHKWLQDVVDFKGPISEGELLLQEICKTQKANQKADISKLAMKIIKLYPNDFWGYYELGMYQEHVLKNYPAAIETFYTAAEKSNNPIIAYNFLGYIYMANKQMDEAATAFKKYLELAPQNANAFHSLGDYYFTSGDYQNAYDYYMKAHRIDSTVFSSDAAENAKIMMDSLLHVANYGL